MPTPSTPQDLLAHMAAGLSAARPRRVGLEYERLGVVRETGEALPYDGPRSVVAVLEALARDHGWRPVGGPPLLELEKDGSRVTLEPGAQIEISARPHRGLREAHAEIQGFVQDLRHVSRPMGVSWLPLGLQPLTPPASIGSIPKERYRIMAAYLPSRGRLAHWMMRATAGMQVNLDVGDAAEAPGALRVALATSSVATALFANSPLSEGRANGWASRRARVWCEVDPRRCGLPAPLLRPGAELRDYVDFALDAPMFFIERDGRLLDRTGVTFRRFLGEGAGGHHATLADFDLHLTTLFPEARLKTYLEIRCGDSNRVDLLMAFAALYQGLLYGGRETHAAALALTTAWPRAERLAFHEDCARRGLRATVPDGRTARELAAELLDIAAAALTRAGGDDARFLDPARELADDGRTPADAVLESWTGVWRGSPAAAAAALDIV